MSTDSCIAQMLCGLKALEDLGSSKYAMRLSQSQLVITVLLETVLLLLDMAPSFSFPACARVGSVEAHDS